MEDNLDYKILLDSYFKALDLSGDKRRSRRKTLKSFDAIIKVGNKQYFSLTRYTDGRMEHLDHIGTKALTSDDFHVLEFYSDVSRDMLFEWIFLTKIFIDSIPDSKSSPPMTKLQQVFDKILEQHIAISKHNASANKLLFKLVCITPKETGSPKNVKADK